MSSKTSLLARIGLVLVGTLVAVGITAGIAFAHIFEFTINPDATLAPGGLQIVVTGTLLCRSVFGFPTGETAFVSVTVAQEKGQENATAFGGSGPIACDGSVQTWGVTANSSRPFKNGPAGALGFASSFGPDGFDSATTTERLHLQ